MAQPGSEAAHVEKLRALAGDAANLVVTGPKKYPSVDAETLDRLTAEGFVCSVTQRDMRLLFYRHNDQVHVLVTELVHGGYRRRYRKVSAQSSATLISALQ